MNNENSKVKITFPIPVDRPNRNGTIFTKQAVENAVNNLHRNLPIIYDGETESGVIGVTTGTSHIATWDDDNRVCKVTVEGVVYNGGPELAVHKTKDGKVSSFEIVGFWVDKGERFDD